MKTNLIIAMLMALLFTISNHASAQNKDIEITYKRNDDNSIDFHYHKTKPGSYYLKVDFTNLSNCNPEIVERVVKNPDGLVCKLKPLNASEGINFSYKYYYQLGNPYPRIMKDYPYLLPFKTGDSLHIKETTRLSEVYLKAEKDFEWKSFLTFRKQADTVRCMRKGLVVKIEDKNDTDLSVDYNYTSQMNSILIEHEDGTIAEYKGFNKNGIFVKLGQTVYPQTQLGILDEINKSDYRLYFSIMYLNKERLVNEAKTKEKKQTAWTNIDPVFYFTNSLAHLKDEQTYVVENNDEIFYKEFSRREIKRYQKDNSSFK